VRVAEALLEPLHHAAQPRRHRLVPRLRVDLRIRAAEHLGEHRQDVGLLLLLPPRLGGFAFAPLPRRHFLPPGRVDARHGLHADDQRDDEAEHDGQRRAEHERMALREPCQHVQRRRRPRLDRPSRQQPPQVVGEGRHAGVPAIGLLAQSARDDRLQVAAQRAVAFAERPRRLLRDAPQAARQRIGGDVDGQRAGEQLVGDDAEAVDVRAHVDPRRVAARLLGAHVRQGAEQLAVPGLPRGVAVEVEQAGDAEVEDLAPAGFVDQHVGGLEVAVHQPALVRVADRLGDGDHHADPLGERARGGLRPLLQRDAAHEFHRQERLFAGRRAERAGGEDLGDPGMLQPAERFGLQQQPRAAGRADELRGQHLERDLPARPFLLGAVDDAHAAAAEQREHAELADALGQRLVVAGEIAPQRPQAGLVEVARVRVAAQQFLDLGAQTLVPRALLAQVRRPRRPVEGQRGGEDPLRRRHGLAQCSPATASLTSRGAFRCRPSSRRHWRS
jgi:hypothetical protein